MRKERERKKEGEKIGVKKVVRKRVGGMPFIALGPPTMTLPEEEEHGMAE